MLNGNVLQVAYYCGNNEINKNLCIQNFLSLHRFERLDETKLF